MTPEEQSLLQEMDRLKGILNRIQDSATELADMCESVKAHAESRKTTVEPTWGEVTRIARMIDRVDDEADDVKRVMFRVLEMNTDLQLILGGV